MKKKFCTAIATLVSILLFTIGMDYNEKNELISVSYPSGYSFTYEYDNMGNRTSMTVHVPDVAPGSPEYIQITAQSNGMQLSWNPVIQNAEGTPIIVNVYRVEYSDNPEQGFNPLGTISSCYYLDTTVVGNSVRFYRVIAVTGESREILKPTNKEKEIPSLK